MCIRDSSNAELSDKEKDMIENNSNYSTASIVGGSAKLVKEERDKAIQEKIEDRRISTPLISSSSGSASILSKIVSIFSNSRSCRS